MHVRGLGILRDETTAPPAFACAGVEASLSTLAPSNFAHWKNSASFISVSDCSGVFERSRREQVTFESGSSNAMSIGNGMVR